MARDDENQGNGNEGRQIECQAVFERNGQVDPAVVLYRRKIDHSGPPGDEVPGSESDEDRAHAQVAVAAAVEQDDQCQHQRSQPEVPGVAERPRFTAGRPASAGDDAHFDQAHADECDDNTRDQRRNNFLGVTQQAADNHFDGGGSDADAEDQRQAAQHARGDDRADERKARTLYAQQSGTDASDPPALDESG